MPIQIMVQWDTAGLASFDRYLGTHKGVELEKRVDKAAGKAVRPLAGAIKDAEKSSGIQNRTGKHFKSINARRSRKRPGELTAWTAGPGGPTAHLLVDGHRIVTPGGRDTGRRSRAFPYVQPVVDRYAPGIAEQVGSEVWAEQFR